MVDNEIYLILEELTERVKKLEQDSHPPVDWKELINSNSRRLDFLEGKDEQRP